MIASMLCKDGGNGEDDCPFQRKQPEAVYNNLLPIEAGPSQTRGAGTTIQTAEFISQFTRSLHLQLWKFAKKTGLHLVERYAKCKTPTTMVVSQHSEEAHEKRAAKEKSLYLSMPASGRMTPPLFHDRRFNRLPTSDVHHVEPFRLPTCQSSRKVACHSCPNQCFFLAD